MSLKLEKIAAEREKARRKRDEWEERRKEWDRKYHEQENSEICEMVHAQSLTPEQLAVSDWNSDTKPYLSGENRICSV